MGFRTADEGEQESVTRLLDRAFHDGPVSVWIFPGAANRHPASRVDGRSWPASGSSPGVVGRTCAAKPGFGAPTDPARWTRRRVTLEDIAPRHRRLALAETLAHLDMLRAQHRLSKVFEPGKMLYRRVKGEG